eukprot:CAMPEP_0197473944 /NCGR_PEP_ID=MMETSP1309-20131121/5383_1 /TAXON_ID=464262 /ORGANISM="Genus nov. species nov., Strain RCC998" /LENGTH=234 /DNA_ID=CAMNT_0043013355 /DNA_START=111 /DNA_END=815 /DNA_ORIENTATION=-
MLLPLNLLHLSLFLLMLSKQTGADVDKSEDNSSASSVQCPPASFKRFKELNLSAWTEHEWYVQQQQKVRFQDDYFCVRAEYKPTEVPSSFEMLFSATPDLSGFRNGEERFFPLMTTIDDMEDPSMQSLGFVEEQVRTIMPDYKGPIGELWVLYAGPTQDNYSYGIVSGGPPKRSGENGCIAGDEEEIYGSGLWLYTKDPIPEEGTIEMLREKAKELGFDLGVLKNVTQEGCTYT